jgi:Na+-translocating ferredoxin:NAD+ oxidoreductase RnfD subunit
VRDRSARLRAFVRTPKGLLLPILIALVAIAAPMEGLGVVAPGVLAAVVTAGVIDAIALRVRRGRWEFPDGALISGLLVAMVLSAQQPWHYAAATAAIAIVSKYVFRTRAANVFNPAAIALVATTHLFHTGQSWWGALPNLPLLVQAAVPASGVFIANRVNRMPLVLSFLGAYFLLFTAATFAIEPGGVAEIFRTPDAQAALFFAVFILSDPPTSPVPYGDQIVCGVLVAIVSFVVFMWAGAVYFLLAGVLVGNLWEAWRRVARRLHHTFPFGVADFLREISPWRARAVATPVPRQRQPPTRVPTADI